MPPDPATPGTPGTPVTRVNALRRHRLVRLHAWAWDEVVARGWDPVARACTDHWAAHDLPLVVTTQRAAPGDGQAPVSLGLAAPLQWERRRMALQVPHAAIASLAEFPLAADIACSLPAESRAAFAALARAVADDGADMRAFGSHGWQRLTGLAHVREGSDVDLCVAVGGPAQADAACGRLLAFESQGPRLDGELTFPDGRAVHWREWAAWRRGDTARLLVKRLDGAELVSEFREAVAA